MIYCPYIDKEIPEEQTNQEHIIPLSLGGINGFEIPVDRKFNLEVGSKIDGAIANDMIVIMKRNELDIRGHSGKKPAFVSKKSTLMETGKPVQVTFDKMEGVKVWDPIDKKYLQGQGVISSKFTMPIDSDIKFVAKVALSAGYFVYGDLFRENVAHDEIRFIMNFDMDINNPKAKEIKTRVDSRFSDSTDPTMQTLRALCGLLGSSSVVGFLPGPSNLGVFVGVLGNYMGMLNVPANTTNFPRFDEYDLGHVIAIQDGMLKRVSFRRAMEKLYQRLSQQSSSPASSAD